MSPSRKVGSGFDPQENQGPDPPPPPKKKEHGFGSDIIIFPPYYFLELNPNIKVNIIVILILNHNFGSIVPIVFFYTDTGGRGGGGLRGIPNSSQTGHNRHF